MRGTPFSRFNAFMVAVAAAIAATPGMTRTMAIQQVGGYTSRGKGSGGGNRRPAGAHMAFVRKARKARNK